MSKVEDLARKYCEGSSFEDACMEKPAYIAGYHQAEKDRELTWKDMELIYEITYEESRNVSLNKGGDISEEEFYQEVLKRFKERKGEVI